MKFLRWRKPSLPSAEEIDRILAAGVSRRECAAFLDSFQRSAFEKLADDHGDVTFARLMALKLANLAAGRYHMANRHSSLSSHPIQLMVDPANACQLGCPACVHTTNKAYAALFDWPRTTLPVETYDAFVDSFGPFAFAASLYNYGEPLLNKHFTAIVRASKEYLLYTTTSTNLSLPLNDTDAIVSSGLDSMILSIDGTTQTVYERYRRKGNLALVLENVAKLVSSKKRLGSTTPHLAWQFLTFEHNEHQVEEAMRLAQELGVDQINVERPFEVDADDPTIRPVSSKWQGGHVFHAWDRRWLEPAHRQAIRNRATTIDAAFAKSWKTRLEEAPETASPRATAGTCWWLYFNMTLDGAGRVMPCCMAPAKTEKKVVFANFEPGTKASPLRVVNSPMATMARMAFSDRESYERRAAAVAFEQRPHCAVCSDTPSSPYNLTDIRADLRMFDASGVLSADLIDRLVAWPGYSGQ